MPIFKTDKVNLKPISEKHFKLEKEMQKLTENNLKQIFGYDFIRSEFPLQNLSIDTLAFNEENKSFVILEYKRDKSFSVVDQGYAYLALMLNNKADFVLEYNERKNANLRKKDVDWSQSKVLFLAGSFTPYQLSAINFRDLPIELWEVKLFGNDIVLFNQLKSPGTSESIKTISRDKTIEKVSKEVKVYTLENHYERTSQEMKELFLNLQEKILAIGTDVKESVGKWALVYKVNYLTFVYVHLRKNELHLYLRLPRLSKLPPVAMNRQVKEEDAFKVAAKIKSSTDITPVVELVSKAYENVLKDMP